MLVAVEGIAEEKRFSERMRSFLANLLSAGLPEAAEIARQLLHRESTRGLLVEESIRHCVRALADVAWGTGGIEGREALEEARVTASTLEARDVQQFGSILLSTRLHNYNADFVNSETRFEMIRVHWAPGAHTDAFDDSPKGDGWWLVELLLAEAEYRQGESKAASVRLLGLMNSLRHVSSIPPGDWVPRYTEVQEVARSLWAQRLCEPLAKELGLMTLDNRHPTDVVTLGSSSTFEELYPMLCDAESWAREPVAELLVQILLRSSTEPRSRCRLLLLLLLRGFSQYKVVWSHGDDPAERTALAAVLSKLSESEIAAVALD